VGAVSGDVRRGQPDARPGTAPGDPAVGMRFPQVARLQLDELLDELVTRAHDVQDAQGRLRGLLRAYLAVARADDLHTVLRHIVEAARELVNAGYAALGVVSGGRLVRFVHTGMDPEVVARVGHLPDGKGLLGLLVDYPQTLRLRDIAEHVASVGFPEHHPPMRSFLGVPIRVADRVFGNLYLTDKQGADEFTSDDEELAQALAAAAGVAIENATLLAESRRRQTWQSAMVEVTTRLLGGADPDEVLRRLIHHARQTLRGDGAGVSIPTDDPELWHMAATEGTHRPWQGAPIPREGTITGAAIAAQGLIVITDPGTDPRTPATAEHASGVIGETAAIPISGDGGVNGVLAVSRRPGAEPFDDLDLDLITAVAAHAGLAMHLTEIRRDNEQLRLVEDRAQIAEDLRHRVIQRLFGHGLALQAAASRATNPNTRTAIEAQIDEVDDIIHDIRAAIFTLNPAAPGSPAPADRPADPDGGAL
jgi:two-component system, NarL family, sensor histidine kinase DevS